MVSGYSRYTKNSDYSNKDGLRDLLSAVIYLIVVVGIMIGFIPFFSNFGPGGGATDRVNLEKMWSYVGYGVAFGLIVFAIKITRLLTKGKHKWLDVPIFDPENSVFARFGLFKPSNYVVSFFILFLFFVALSGAIAIGGAIAQSSNYPNTAIPDVAFVEQSAWKSPTELALSVYPASPSETTALLFFITVVRMIIYATYFSLTKARNVNIVLIFILDLLILPFLGGAYWWGFHLLRYGASETAQISVFTFGSLSTLFITTTYSYFPAQIYHDINNFVQKYITIFQSEIAIIPLAIAEILAIVGLVNLIAYARNKSKNPQGV